MMPGVASSLFPSPPRASSHRALRHRTTFTPERMSVLLGMFCCRLVPMHVPALTKFEVVQPAPVLQILSPLLQYSCMWVMSIFV